MPTPVLTPLPPAPTPADAPDVFASKAGTFVTAQVGLVPQQNAAFVWQAQQLVDTQAARDAAATSAGNAADSATLAGQKVGLAADQVALAVNAKDQAALSATSALTYAQASGASAGIPPAVANSALFTDAAGNAFWGKAGLVRSARTSNTVLAVADRSILVDITSGTFTQTFTAAATLGSGWFCYIQNSGSGDITLDPNSAETIDGLTSFVMYPGETRIVQCDGTAFRSIVLNAFSKVFTASGNFIKPPGYKQFGGIMWSGGGSGRKGGADAYGGSGSAGVPFTFPESAFSASTALVVGAGGAAITAANTSGNVGGTSTFMGLYCGPGAAGTTSPGIGGNAYKIGPTNTALQGAAMSVADSVYGGAGQRSSTGSLQYGDTVYGGAAGGWIVTNVVNTTPSLTVFGGIGGAASLASSGVDGTAPGGGGGATQTGTQSGAGARGELRIWGVV